MVLTDYELWGLDGDYSNYSYPILNEPGMLEDVVTLNHNDRNMVVNYYICRKTILRI